MRLVATAWALALVACLPSVARADSENGLGLGPRVAAQGGAVSAVPVGVAAVHYDPAALAIGPDEPGFVELTAAFLWAHPVLYVEGLDGADAPELVAEPRDTAALLLGTRFDLGSGLGVDGLHAALALYTPVSHIFAYSNHPDDRPQWLEWTDRTQHIGIWAGLGWRIADWLSVGASLRVLFDLELYTTGRVRSVERGIDPATGETAVTADTELGEELRVYGRVAPILGVVVTPVPDLAPDLHVGLAWRAETMVDDWGWARVVGETGGLGNLGYVYRFAHYYRPHELVLSASVRPVPALRLSVDLTWAMWSLAVTGTHAEVPGRFGDVLVPAIGAAWTASPGVELLAGYRFEPAFFDDLGGPTNLLENTKHVPSIGMELDLATLTGEPIPFRVSWSLRLAVLVQDEEKKDWRRFESDAALEANPGSPGYRYGGVVPSAQVAAEASW